MNFNYAGASEPALHYVSLGDVSESIGKICISTSVPWICPSITSLIECICISMTFQDKWPIHPSSTSLVQYILMVQYCFVLKHTLFKLASTVVLVREERIWVALKPFTLSRIAFMSIYCQLCGERRSVGWEMFLWVSVEKRLCPSPNSWLGLSIKRKGCGRYSSIGFSILVRKPGKYMKISSKPRAKQLDTLIFKRRLAERAKVECMS